MDDLLKRLADLGIGAVSISRDKLEKKLKEWTDQKLLTPSEAKRWLDAVAERGEQERAELQRVVQEQVEKALTRLGLLARDPAPTAAPSASAADEPLSAAAASAALPVTRADIERLERRIAELERLLGERAGIGGEDSRQDGETT
ncbi:MAG: hypothetical protein IRZ33_10590 [Alicyclobacillaceae bacterium]|nr:hypothetical protein [Alicyclobacillaceae bacterium]